MHSSVKLIAHFCLPSSCPIFYFSNKLGHNLQSAIMAAKLSTSSSDRTSKKNHYIFNIDNDRQIEISSNFQNGNISLVKQIHQLYYILESISDIECQQSKKSWFYFRIKSTRGIKVRLIVQNVNIYETIFEEKYHCKPFCREGQAGPWLEVADSFLTLRDQVVLVIDHTFKSSEYVYFCLTIPFTFEDNERYLQKIRENVHPYILYRDEILTETPQKRPVHLLTITQRSKGVQENVDKKPVVLITSRVHPGEVSSSYVLQGMLEFLLSYNNFQAFLLRKLFVFKIIPIVNPDGVCLGNYRMDPQGYNLNRFYQNPSAEQHPSIFHISQLMKSLASQQKIQFYFDLHSHSSIKEAFIYGNALDDIVSQTYSELFCKILEENYPRFRTGLSNFGQKQMRHKDRGELLSKQGCGRVVINKLYGVLQSYTVQSSIFPSAYDYPISRSSKNQQKNQEFTYQSPQTQQIYAFQSSYHPSSQYQNVMVTQNKLLGRSIMISMLDMLKKNPYTRLPYEFNDNYCKDHSARLFQNQERFKLLDMKAYQKCKMITHLIKLTVEDRLDKEWNLCGVRADINAISWPSQFRRISVCEEIMAKDSKSLLKGRRVKTEGRQKLTSKSLTKSKKPLNFKIIKRQENNGSHRSISPKQLETIPGQVVFPQIKYSIQLKSQKPKESVQLKSATVKQIQLNMTQGSKVIYEGDRLKKRMILDYIQEEIGKINPDKQIFKRSNASLNRLIANKILQKERAKNRNSQMGEYQKIILESRKRIVTESREDETLLIIKDRIAQIGEEDIKGLELKKAEMIKKRVIAANKAIELIKRTDKAKIKLPDLNKLSLMVQNSKKQKQRPIFLDQPLLRSHPQPNPAP